MENTQKVAANKGREEEGQGRPGGPGEAQGGDLHLESSWAGQRTPGTSCHWTRSKVQAGPSHPSLMGVGPGLGIYRSVFSGRRKSAELHSIRWLGTELIKSCVCLRACVHACVCV